MRRAIAPLWLAVGLLPTACDDSLVDELFTEAEWQKISRSSPLPPPPPSPTNRFADRVDVAELGQRLWFEKRYAGALSVQGTAENGGLGNMGETGKVSCASCHNPEHWFTDVRSKPNALSLGTDWTGRNAPSMVNVVYYEWGNWAGSHDQFWKQGAGSPESRDNFNSDRMRYVRVIYSYYRDHYNALFDPDLPAELDPETGDLARFPLSAKPRTDGTIGPWEKMHPDDQHIVKTIMANCGKSLEAYERLLISGDSAFDRYVAGDFDALNASAKRGLKLFMGKAGCGSCHTSETFTDQEFHNTGVEQSNLAPNFDNGRFYDAGRFKSDWNGDSIYSDDPELGKAKLDGLVPMPSMVGQFRTKSLRHVTETGPYFHNGSVATLTDVVRFYNRGGGAEGTYPGIKDERLVPLHLTEGEIADIVEFLGSLTGKPIPAYLTVDTSAVAPVL